MKISKTHKRLPIDSTNRRNYGAIGSSLMFRIEIHELEGCFVLGRQK